MKINIEPPIKWKIFSETFLVTAYTDKKIYIQRSNEQKISIISRNTLNKEEESLNELLKKSSKENLNPINIKEKFPEYFL